jgi:hypothetical protein
MRLRNGVEVAALEDWVKSVEELDRDGKRIWRGTLL